MSLIAFAALTACQHTARVQKVDVSISADPTCSDASADSAEPHDSTPAWDCDVACSDCGDNLLAWGGICIEDFVRDDGDAVVYTTSIHRGEISDLIWIEYTGDADHGDYVRTEPFNIVLTRSFEQDRPLNVNAAYRDTITLYTLDEDGNPNLRENEGVLASVDGNELTFAYLDGGVPIAEHHTVGPFRERRLRVQDIPCCNVGPRSADAAATVLATLLIVALRRRPAL